MKFSEVERFQKSSNFRGSYGRICLLTHFRGLELRSEMDTFAKRAKNLAGLMCARTNKGILFRFGTLELIKFPVQALVGLGISWKNTNSQ